MKIDLNLTPVTIATFLFRGKRAVLEISLITKAVKEFQLVVSFTFLYFFFPESYMLIV